MIKCLYCPFQAKTISELLDHEDQEHGAMVETLEGVDGNEGQEDITGEEPEEEPEEE